MKEGMLATVFAVTFALILLGAYDRSLSECSESELVSWKSRFLPRSEMGANGGSNNAAESNPTSGECFGIWSVLVNALVEDLD
jgi:hypothetical protein